QAFPKTNALRMFVPEVEAGAIDSASRTARQPTERGDARGRDGGVREELAKGKNLSPSIRVTPPPVPPLGWVYNYYAPCADPQCRTVVVNVDAAGLNVRTAPNGYPVMFTR